MTRAIVVNGILSGPQEMRVSNDWKLREVGDTDVEVDIKAIGANFFDILMVQGKYQHKPDPPYVPGAEYAGIVTKVGNGVTKVKVGDRIFGGTLEGAYSDKIVVNEMQVFPLHDRLSFEQGAGIYVTYPTSWAALTLRANVQPGETVLVHAAAGGVGICAVQIAKLLGAKVIATAGSDEKLKIVKEKVGADYTINYRTQDWIKEVKKITGGKGADVVYDPVGLIEESLRCINWNGRILVIGFAAGTIPKIAVNRILLKNCSVVGLHWGAYTYNEPEAVPGVWEKLLTNFASGKLTPIVYERVYDGLEQAGEALTALGNRQTYGKVIVRPNGQSARM
eukprot:Clim_evm1s166 gene=Clim_evmTU1s166